MVGEFNHSLEEFPYMLKIIIQKFDKFPWEKNSKFLKEGKRFDWISNS